MAKKVLLFARNNTPTGRRLKDHIERVVPTENLETFHDFQSLSRRLHKCLQNLAIAVLGAETREDLVRLLDLKELFADIRVILTLPDQASETIRAGHRLRPRYLSYNDSDFSDVAEVLETMLRRFPLTGETGLAMDLVAAAKVRSCK